MADISAAAGSIAIRFNDCVNRRDLAGLGELMTEDHRFVDTAGAVVSGRDECLSAWRGFFASFPDYCNVFESVTVNGDRVAIAGRSECSEPALTGRALWTVEVRDGRVREWRVYEDTPATRQAIATAIA